jgi:TolB protein
MNRALALAVAFGLPTSLAHATDFEILVQGERSLALGLPPADGGARLSKFDDTLRRDLDLSGFFTLQTTPPAEDAGTPAAEPNLAAWRASGAVRVAATAVRAPGEAGCPATSAQVCVDVYVHDAIAGSRIGAFRLRGDVDASRALAHQTANAILGALGCGKGFFDGVLAAVRTQGKGREIVAVSTDGSDVTAVTRNGSTNLSPAWSPDGKRIAWTTYRRGNADVYVKDLSSGAVHTLSTGLGGDLAPAFSPDGATVALARTEGSNTDIYLLEADSGRTVRRITTDPAIDVSPAFLNRTELVFTSDRAGGKPGIYRVSTSGGTPSPVQTGGRMSDPVVTADGRRVAFVVQHGGFDVWTADLASGAITKITDGRGGDNTDPTWSPDGRYLAFTSTRSGRSELWIASSDGKYQVQLTEGGGFSMPAWRPE